MEKENLDLLIDTAASLIEKAPYEAYLLLKMAQQYRPNGPRIKMLLSNITPKTHDNAIVAWRHDGLCERLITIIIGFFTAKALGLDFKIVWPDDSFMAKHFMNSYGNGHSVPTTANSILSDKLIRTNLISECDILHPAGQFSFNYNIVKRLTVCEFATVQNGQQTIRPCWVASNRLFPDIEARYSHADYRRFFLEELISDRLIAELDNIQNLKTPKKRVALHVRGGDIIYGDARLVSVFGRVKSVSLAVADAICESYTSQGYSVWVFGATKSDLTHLSQKYPSVLCVDDFQLSDTDTDAEMIRELMLMADCDQIITAQDTAVTKLAAILGNAKMVTIEDLFNDDEEHQVLKEYTSSDSFRDVHPLQKSFIYFGLFVTAPIDTNSETRLDYIWQAHRCDPENIRYLVIVYLAKIAAGKFDQAELVIDLLSNELEVPVQRFFDKRELNKRYIHFADKSVVPLVLQISNMKTVPERALNIVKGLLDQTPKKFLTDGPYAGRTPHPVSKRLLNYFRAAFVRLNLVTKYSE